MGNRAVVIFETPQDSRSQGFGPAVYLHWNGGPESIYAFLDELERRKVRASNIPYLTARFVHVVCDFFDDPEATAFSVGVLAPPASLSAASLAGIDPGDNGVFLISPGPGGKGWHVRRFFNGKEQSRRFVAKERRDAMAHEYNQLRTVAGPAGIPHRTIAETFAAIRPKVSQNG